MRFSGAVLTNPLRRLHAEERGIALIVAMAMLLILGIIAAAVFTNALQIKNATATERSSKQAYAAAVNGLRSAMYWLNAYAPSDTSCPPLPGQTVAQAASGTSGLCGPYESDNMSGLSGVTTQPLVGQRFTYWISPVMTSGTDTCTGTPPRVTSGASGVTVRDRCITAVGQALVGTQIKSTRRIQARVSATNAAFPVPGIFGAACLSAGVTFNAGTTDCSTQGSGVSGSDYYGTVGSNGPVNMNIKTWSYDPAVNPDAGASLYLGALSPSDPTTPSYTIKLQSNPVGTPDPTGCGNGQTFCTGSQPPLPYNTSATGPYQNPVHEFGRWYQPYRMGNYFARLDQFAPMKLPGHSLPVGCASYDVSVCNNNSLITSASGTPAGCGTLASNRALTLANNCILRIPNGTYDLCDISFGQDSSILPTDTTANAEVRIFLDSPTRTTAASPCAASGPNKTKGDISWPNSGHPARWMTTGPASVPSPQNCPTAFPDAWTALAGQLFVYGAGDPTDANTNYPVNTSPLEIPGMMFDGSIMAMNTMLNVTTSNTCINGGIAAGKINLNNNVGFKWDPNVGKSELSNTSTTFYRTAYSTCTSAGFRFTTTTTAPTYPANPSTGC